MKRFVFLFLALCVLFCMTIYLDSRTEDISEENNHTHYYNPATCSQPEACFVCGLTRGVTLAHTFSFGKCTECDTYSELDCPILIFSGDMSNMTTKKVVKKIEFEYRDKEKTFSGFAEIMLQGSSSLSYAKKNYTIILYEDQGFTKEMGINVGWGNQSTYCLKANWVDKTHARNVVTAKLVGEIQKSYGLLDIAPNNGAVDGFPVAIYINGDFHGLYTMNIPKDTWMFGMDENNPNHIVVSGGNWNDPVLFKEIPTDLADWEVEVGQENDETLKKLQRLVEFVRDSSDEDFKNNFAQYLDLDATLNYYILLRYGWMPDNTGKNMLLVTYDGNVWYPSLYDLDSTWGVSWNGQELLSYKDTLLSCNSSRLWKRFSELYKEEITDRYFELRSTFLDTEYVMSKFNKFYNSIPQEVLMYETQKWNTVETPIPGFPLSQIQEYLDSVVPRLDAEINE